MSDTSNLDKEEYQRIQVIDKGDQDISHTNPVYVIAMKEIISYIILSKPNGF